MKKNLNIFDFPSDDYGDTEVNTSNHTELHNHEDIKQIIFDTETTGLDAEDRIIQVGAIIEGLEDSKDFITRNELCKPLNDEKILIPIKIEAMATHGIRQVQIDNEENTFSETNFFKDLNQLNNQKNYLIAHNLDFDLTMLKKEGFENNLKLVDTYQCAKHLYDIGDDIKGYKLPNYKLQTFRYILFTQDDENVEANKYGAEIKAHDAMGDVVILKLFLNELKKKIEKVYGIENPIAIMDKMVELTKTPMPVEKIRFPVGEFRGRKIIEVEKENPGLLTWYITKFKQPDKEVVDAIKKLKGMQ